MKHHSIKNVWADLCWFADFGAHRRLLHLSGLVCPLLLAGLGLSWMWEHTPHTLGDVLSAGGLMPVALLALRRRVQA